MRIILFFVLLYSQALFAVRDWTHTYQFHYSDSGEFCADHPFTQLLVSWNAREPISGFLRFYLDVYDEKNKKWTTYKMYEWGRGINRSFMSKDSSSSAQYVYVRFEGATGRKYRKFRVYVEGCKGASKDNVKSLFVVASDLSHFEPELLSDIPVTIAGKSRKYIAGVPCISQMLNAYPESAGWCSPTSLAQIVEFYTQRTLNLPRFAQDVFDKSLAMYGSWPFNVAQASLYLPEHACYVTRMSSIRELLECLAHGYPVVVSICSRQILPGAPKAYDKGHLITVVGFDLRKKKIICHDTAEKDTHAMIKHYPLVQFMRAWENRYRLSYVIQPTY